MDYKFTKGTELLLVDISGQFALEPFRELLKKIGSEVERQVIINGSLLQNSHLSYEIRYELVIAANKYLNVGTHYAVVWPAKNINYYTIDTLSRLGMSIKIFPNLVKAKKWLQSRP